MLTDWDRGPFVPENNLKGIVRLINEGGAFSIASGRQYMDTMSFFPRHFFNAPSVQANGAAIWDCSTDTVLETVVFPQPCKEELVEYTRSYKNLWLACADDTLIYEILFCDERDGGLHDAPSIRPQISIEEFFSRDFLKVCFILGDPEDMPRLKSVYESMECSKLLNASTSSPIYLECFNKNADKGIGVLKSKKLSGFSDKKLVCIGDYFNDESMLRAADISVCPSSAPQEIKDICSIVTRSSNNDGAIAELVQILADM